VRKLLENPVTLGVSGGQVDENGRRILGDTHEPGKIDITVGAPNGVVLTRRVLKVLVVGVVVK